VRLRLFLLLLLALVLSLPAAREAFSRPPQEETTVVSLMHRAAEERRRGDYAAAAETYRQVLRRAPRLFEAHLFLADTLRKRRLDAEAEREFQTARRIRPEDPLPYVGLADMRREAFRFPEALALLEEGWRAVPPEKREPLLAAQGTTLRQAGEAEKAVEILGRGMKDFPSSSRIPEALARSQEACGRLAEALETWTLAGRLAPDNASISLASKEARDLALRLEQAEAAARKPDAAAGSWEELARLRMVARQFPAAAEAAAAALRLEPGRTDLILLRGLALERAGRAEEAEALLRKIGAGALEHLPALYHRAYLARLRKDDAAEEKIWREAAGRHPGDNSAALMLVLHWKRRGKLDAWISRLREEPERGKGRSFPRILEGMALEEAGRDREAAQVYEDLFLEDPRDPRSAARLSALLALRPALLAGRLEEESSRHAREGKGDGPGRHLLLGQILEAAGREKEAMEEMKEAAGLFPDREEVHLGLASALFAAGDPAAISRALDRALELAPDSPWAHLAKGLALVQRGDFDPAIREGEKVVALAPDLPEGRQLLGAARRSAGDYPGAVRELQASLLLDPADSPGVVRFQMALALAAQGDRRAARAALEGEMPPFPEMIYRLAWSFVRLAFLDRSFRGQDWLSWRDRFTDPSASPQVACAAVSEMLASLRDPYTRLRVEEETAALYLMPRSGKLETDAAGSPSRSSASVLTEDLGENLGYIRLTNLSDPSAREAIRRALDRMAQRDGLVLDLRGNPGGLASDADAIAGLLLEPGEEMGRERTRFGERVSTAPRTRSSFPRRPIVVLTDRRTGSAAEKLAAGLQGSGRATIIGEGTFGKGVGQMSRLLPGGEMVLVSAVENLTLGGRSLQGEGVVPDLPGGGDVSLEKAKELLRKPATP